MRYEGQFDQSSNLANSHRELIAAETILRTGYGREIKSSEAVRGHSVVDINRDVLQQQSKHSCMSLGRCVINNCGSRTVSPVHADVRCLQ